MVSTSCEAPGKFNTKLIEGTDVSKDKIVTNSEKKKENSILNVSYFTCLEFTGCDYSKLTTYVVTLAFVSGLSLVRVASFLERRTRSSSLFLRER